MDSRISIESTQRSEKRFSVSEKDRDQVLSYLYKNGNVVRHGANDLSRIVSVYYECDKIKADNNASIRQRTYLTSGLDDFFRLPCVVDAKVEVSAVDQVKWRRRFDSWQEAERQLCAPPDHRPDDFFPELVRHYGGIGILSKEYGVRYDRLYFSLKEGLSATLDSNIAILFIRSTGELVVVSELSDGILEVKGLTRASPVPDQVRFAAFLRSLGLQPSTPKRAKARMLISEFKDGLKTWPRDLLRDEVST